MVKDHPLADPDDDAPDFLDGAPRFMQQHFWERLHYARRTGRQAVEDMFGGSRIFKSDEEGGRDELGRYAEEAYKACLEGLPVPPRRERL
jgi:hypothetical protein